MAPVCIEWVAVSNAKRKLVWLACKQVWGYAWLSPSFPPIDMGPPSSWTHHQHQH